MKEIPNIYPIPGKMATLKWDFREQYRDIKLLHRIEDIWVCEVLETGENINCFEQEFEINQKFNFLMNGGTNK